MTNQVTDKYDMKLRGHHLNVLLGAIIDPLLPREAYYKYLREEVYGHNVHPEIVDKIKLICEKIILNPDLKVKMVRELDDICLPTCSEMEESCKSDKDKIDSRYLKKYGLKCDHIYSSSELLKVLTQ